ncbi:divergent polysaccharide deacetylase family protein [Afifella sp. JA880]|uniref:divergent polysaccharide deacetylase family protein n=1 Tax=Afifella sp. JA880 TaxID=2975280 RepID=UPI0021BACC48|nr:divergent polysaccharide deacetylase family protein [Afifella sp. JA880]MCT8267701.1 divergent polysaccharide deacetylase family protein [Afifella sp. JA880]
MAADELNAPLKRPARPARKGRLRWLFYVPLVLAGVVFVTALMWTALVDDPDGGRAVAVADVKGAGPETTGSIDKTSLKDARRQALAAPGWEMEAGASAPSDVGSLFTDPAQPGAAASSEPQTDFERMQAALQQAPSSTAFFAGAPLPELQESSAYGPLPRIGDDGTMPREAYARPAYLAPDQPHIAIVVGGLGISQTGTQRAIRALPSDVTFAFAATGSSLNRWAGDARADGHEILLQAPMEPFGYPSTDPGEHTLLVSAKSGANADSLAWILSRAGGYTGIMNYLGGRFTAEADAMRPLLANLGERGLLYVDDGSSDLSVAARLGPSLGTPVVVADRIIDEQRQPALIAKALDDLEAIARQKGRAVGVASAFPSTVSALAEWIPEAEARGIAFVPVSALAQQEE